MIRGLTLLLLAFFGSAHVLDEETPPSPTVEETLASWREAVNFDLPGEVLRAEKECLEKLPALANNGEALDLRIHARLLVEDPDGAKKLLAETELSSGFDCQERLARARIALFEDELDEVVEILQSKDAAELSKECADVQDAWLVLGRAHARAGRLSEAATMLHQFILRDPFHPETPSAWHMMSQNSFRRGQNTQARQYAKAASQAANWQAYYKARRLQVRENPKAVLPRIGLVILWMQADTPERAREELERIFELEPNHCEALGHLAEAERKLGNLDAARAAYDRALECDPTHVGLRFNRAFLAGLQGRPGDARLDYEWICASEHEADERYRTAHLELARILRAAGEKEAAEKRYARYAELGGEEPLEPAD